MSSFANTPEPPYYAVIFTSKRADVGSTDYQQMARLMEELAAEQPGFLGLESARTSDGLGITVSYWESRAAIATWKTHAEHQVAQRMGRERWYNQYELRIAHVETAYGFNNSDDC